jgi:hypothetical protein
MSRLPMKKENMDTPKMYWTGVSATKSPTAVVANMPPMTRGTI